MKSPKQVIDDAIKKLQTRAQNQSNSVPDDNDACLGPFDLIPIQFTGMIEDYLFRQSRQIFNILKNDHDHDIEGLTYDQIRNDITKNAYYDKVRHNIPKYYALKPSDRQKHFKIEGELYLQRLGVRPEQLESNFQTEAGRLKDDQVRESTPMKSVQISKKEALQIKKQEKKINTKISQKADTKKDIDLNIQKKQNEGQRYNTPEKKQKERKKVKFFEFQYVKDFSQHKTPKRLAIAEELKEPLKEIQLSDKKRD